MIDGQHRLGGFGKIRNKFLFSKEISSGLFLELMSYEFPVVFVDLKDTTKTIETK
jgi:hypothetical protein